MLVMYYQSKFSFHKQGDVFVVLHLLVPSSLSPLSSGLISLHLVSLSLLSLLLWSPSLTQLESLLGVAAQC